NGVGPDVGVVYHSNLFGLGRSGSGEVLAAVTDLPLMVLNTPENFAITAGKTAKLLVTAQRFDKATAPIKIELSPPTPGVSLENNELEAGSGRVELQFRAIVDAKPGKYDVVLRAGAISSPPMELTVLPPPPDEKKPDEKKQEEKK